MAKQATAAGKYSIIVEKDPFDKERGGAYDSEGGGGKDKDSTKGIEDMYELHGIIRAGKIRKAYLKLRKPDRKKKKKSTTMFRTVVEGDLIDGWKVKKITNEGILLARNGKSVNMNVFSSRKARRKTKTPAALLARPTRTSSPPVISGKTVHAATNKKNRADKAKKMPMLKAPVMPTNIANNPFSRLLMQNRENMKLGGGSSGKPGLSMSAPKKTGK